MWRVGDGAGGHPKEKYGALTLSLPSSRTPSLVQGLPPEGKDCGLWSQSGVYVNHGGAPLRSPFKKEVAVQLCVHFPGPP